MIASKSGVRVVEERLDVIDGAPLFVIPDWRERFPWLVAATTGAGEEDDAFDLGLFGAQPVGATLERWRALVGATGMRGAAHSRQAHAARVQTHAHAHEGLLVSDGYDAHVTRAAGLLLTVSVADCVPVFLVDAEARAVALLHAGWRGVAGDVLEAGMAALRTDERTDARHVWMHAGPAICGTCYEVGPEVHEAVGLARPAANTPIDLRAVLADRAAALGIPADQVSLSANCTRCGPGRFFSHRAGQSGRQMGILGVT